MRKSGQRRQRATEAQSETSSATSTRIRRGGKTGGINPIALYIGGGAALLLVVGGALIASSSSVTALLPTGARRASAAQSAAPDTPGEPRTVSPYANAAEAASKLEEAHGLFQRGEQCSHDARNRLYRQARHICHRVLATPGLSKRLQERANKLHYNVFKHESL